MFDLLLIEKRLKEEMLFKDIANECEVSVGHFNKLLKHYELEINFRPHLLRQELIEYLSRNTMQKLISESKIHGRIFEDMAKREEMTFRTMVRVLNFFDVPYTLKLRKREECDIGKDWKRFVVDYPKKSEYMILSKEVIEGKDKHGEELYSHLITSHMNKLNIVMRNQQIGSITQDRIIQAIIDIIKESVNLGTIVERNKDRLIVDVVVQAIKQGKVLDIDKDVL